MTYLTWLQSLCAAIPSDHQAKRDGTMETPWNRVTWDLIVDHVCINMTTEQCKYLERQLYNS